MSLGIDPPRGNVGSVGVGRIVVLVEQLDNRRRHGGGQNGDSVPVHRGLHQLDRSRTTLTAVIYRYDVERRKDGRTGNVVREAQRIAHDDHQDAPIGKANGQDVGGGVDAFVRTVRQGSGWELELSKGPARTGHDAQLRRGQGRGRTARDGGDRTSVGTAGHLGRGRFGQQLAEVGFVQPGPTLRLQVGEGYRRQAIVGQGIVSRCVVPSSIGTATATAALDGTLVPLNVLVHGHPSVGQIAQILPRGLDRCIGVGGRAVPRGRTAVRGGRCVVVVRVVVAVVASVSLAVIIRRTATVGNHPSRCECRCACGHIAAFVVFEWVRRREPSSGGGGGRDRPVGGVSAVVVEWVGSGHGRGALIC